MANKLIELPVHGIRIELNANGAGAITSDHMYETCPKCDKPDCLYQCDGAHLDDIESEDDVVGRIGFNGAVDGIMSMILAHACAGIDTKSAAYIKGIQTAMEAVGANL